MTETAEPTPIPAWLNDVDESERAELEAMGVKLQTPEENSLDALDMLGSELLRRRAGVERALDGIKATQERERQMLTYRQGNVRASLESRATSLDHDLEKLAEIAALKGAFDKKAQSRKTSFGSYGRRRTAERTVIADSNLATAWAIENLPDAVTVKAKLTVKAATALQDEGVITWTADSCSISAADVAAAFDAGAQIPGVEVKPESITYYGKPAVLEADEA